MSAPSVESGAVEAREHAGVRPRGAPAYATQVAVRAGTVAFAVEGLSAQVADFVTLSGDLGLSQINGELVAVGDAMSAQLQAGSAASVVASASPVQPVRPSWTQGQLFAVRGGAAADATGSFAAAAPPM